LNGAATEVSIVAEEDEVFVYNNLTKTAPVIIHGNGASKVLILEK
jgi:hypothetical protein